jgi:hypothetical protein
MTERFERGEDGEIVQNESHQTRNTYASVKKTRLRPINQIIHALNLKARYGVVREGKVRPDFRGKS